MNQPQAAMNRHPLQWFKERLVHVLSTCYNNNDNNNNDDDDDNNDNKQE